MNSDWGKIFGHIINANIYNFKQKGQQITCKNEIGQGWSEAQGCPKIRVQAQ